MFNWLKRFFINRWDTRLNDCIHRIEKDVVESMSDCDFLSRVEIDRSIADDPTSVYIIKKTIMKNPYVIRIKVDKINYFNKAYFISFFRKRNGVYLKREDL